MKTVGVHKKVHLKLPRGTKVLADSVTPQRSNYGRGPGAAFGPWEL